MRDNFATVLETVADVRAERTVVTHGERSLTWGQLDERASRLAAFLAGPIWTCRRNPSMLLGMQGSPVQKGMNLMAARVRYRHE